MKVVTRTAAFYSTHPEGDRRAWDIIFPFVELLWSLNWDDDFLAWDDIVRRHLPRVSPLQFQHKDAP